MAIPFDEHQAWYEGKLNDPYCILFVVEQDKKAIGQVRFDLADNEATVSISLFLASRGKGLGKSILKMASRLIFKLSDADSINAYIKEANVASQHSFRQSGYQLTGKCDI